MRQGHTSVVFRARTHGLIGTATRVSGCSRNRAGRRGTSLGPGVAGPAATRRSLSLKPHTRDNGDRTAAAAAAGLVGPIALLGRARVRAARHVPAAAWRARPPAASLWRPPSAGRRSLLRKGQCQRATPAPPSVPVCEPPRPAARIAETESKQRHKHKHTQPDRQTAGQTVRDRQPLRHARVAVHIWHSR